MQEGYIYKRDLQKTEKSNEIDNPGINRIMVMTEDNHLYENKRS